MRIHCAACLSSFWLPPGFLLSLQGEHIPIHSPRKCSPNNSLRLTLDIPAPLPATYCRLPPPLLLPLLLPVSLSCAGRYTPIIAREMPTRDKHNQLIYNNNEEAPPSSKASDFYIHVYFITIMDVSFTPTPSRWPDARTKVAAEPQPIKTQNNTEELGYLPIRINAFGLTETACTYGISSH